MIISQEVNKIYSPLFKDKARYYILMGGRGAGRSTVASQFIVSKLFAPDFFRCAIMRAVSSDIRHSIWREFNDRIEEQGLRPAIHLTDNDMHAGYGQNIVQAHGFRQSSSGHSAKLKSLASYNTVIIEEAEEVGEAEFRTLDDTLRTVKGDIKIILCLNTPPKNHWIIQKWFDLEESKIEGFYIPRLKADAKNVVFIGGTFKDNEINLDRDTLERYKAYKTEKPAYYWQMIEGFVPEVVRGRIYKGWNLIDEVPERARLIRFGLDFGWFPDPAALVAVYYMDGGYILDEIAYGTELSNEFIAGKIKETGEALVIADSAEPKSIAEIKGYGVDIEGSEKGKDSVNYGIQVVSQKKIAVTKRSKNIWESFENYSWKEDKDGNSLGIPRHEFSHCADALRYALVSLGGGTETKNKVSSYTPKFREFTSKN